MGGWYDKDGNQVKFGQEGIGVLYSDTLKDFEEFKRRTGGVIYQHVHIKEVSELNQEFIKAHCKEFDFAEQTDEVEDRRNKSGYRVNRYFRYYYWGKWYSAKEINKKGVYITKEIHFNTLLDLIPYFPYLVSMFCSSEGKETVYISDKSYVDEQENSFMQHGIESDSAERYRKKLADLYLQVCKDYFLYDLENRTKIVPIGKLHHCVISEQTIDQPTVCDNDKLYDEHYFFEIDDEVDYMHDVEYVWKDGNIKSHWSSPKGVNNAIRLAKIDVEELLKEDIESGNLMIKYVQKL